MMSDIQTSGKDTHSKTTDGVMYSADQIIIPPSLPDVLKNYTKYIIRNQPTDIFAASAEYFERLSKQQRGSDGEVHFTNVQLEGFYAKFVNSSDTVKMSEIEAACATVGIPHTQINQLTTYGNWMEESVPWLRFWALLLASAAGTIQGTIELVCKFMGDNGKVPLAPVIDILTFLIQNDRTLVQPDASALVERLSSSGVKLFPIDELLAKVKQMSE